MKLLLDTHIFLWSLLEPDRLGPAVSRALEDDHNELWLSPITCWECLVLAGRGRVALRPDPERWLRAQLMMLRPHEAPLTHEVAIRSRSLELGHEDPADRFLAATAITFDLTLVTADQRLLEGGAWRVLPNR
jgi:PIN domain nuclease of toxin-antitoxin system